MKDDSRVQPSENRKYLYLKILIALYLGCFCVLCLGRVFSIHIDTYLPICII